MPETEHSQENLAYIRTHVDNIEQLTRFVVASNPQAAKFIEDYLDSKKGAAEVYLALRDGPKNQQELQRLMGQSQANVAKICIHLFEQGIVGKVPDPGGAARFKYCWTDLETLLKVSRIAKRLTRK
jgi:predicted transcriptional regulator